MRWPGAGQGERPPAAKCGNAGRMTLDEEIQTLETQRNLLDEQIHHLRHRRDAIRIEALGGFKAGDIISWEDGPAHKRKMRCGTVLSGFLFLGQNPVYRVRVLRADGYDGAEVEVRVYNNPRLAG